MQKKITPKIRQKSYAIGVTIRTVFGYARKKLRQNVLDNVIFKQLKYFWIYFHQNNFQFQIYWRPNSLLVIDGDMQFALIIKSLNPKLFNMSSVRTASKENLKIGQMSHFGTHFSFKQRQKVLYNLMPYNWERLKNFF